MKTTAIIALLIGVAVGSAFGDPQVPAYHSHNDFLLTSPGSMGFGLYGYGNPALLKYVEKPDVLFTWSDAAGKWNDFHRWGLFLGMPSLGFGMVRDKGPLGDLTDYRISLASGTRKMSFGFGYAWSTGDKAAYSRGDFVTVGSLVRPIRYLSVGLTGAFATSGRDNEGVIDLAIRPLGTELVSIFGDYAVHYGQSAGDGSWSTGAAVELLPGIRLTGRYFDTHALSVGLNLSLGRIGFAGQGYYDQDGEHGYNTYAVRMGAPDRNVIRHYLQRRKKYVSMNLKGTVKYQRYRFFDKSNTLLGLISAIDAAKDDDTIAGIAINTSGMNINWEHAWEVREKLKEFKAAGKHVVMYVDDVGLYQYHFASIADIIVMDPIGDIILEGVRLGRFYLKGTLEKLGLGFDEWRFFKYKSAYEMLSRDSMSEGDKEQLGKITKDFYRLMKTEICESRGIDPDEFDRLVNEEFLILGQDAFEMGLVDTLGRWDDVKDMIERLEGGKKDMVGICSAARYELPKDNYWGERPKIAVIYALGECAMDTGIKARSLSKVIERAGNDKEIKAIVFRVDSPGGSATASDWVAEALKESSEKKPVIVSQGWLAGSGGYWISMYGDTIVAAPNSITGSIGVIGGWIYNKGFKEKLGMSTDIVQVGDHADLGYGISLPLLGRIPDRNLTEDERGKFEHNIKFYYKKFIGKVASGRGTEYDDIEPIAQGRVWSGYDGLEIGLVDVLGGMDKAIEIAKAKIGIPEGEEVELVEMPEPPAFNPAMFTPKLFGIRYEKNEMLEHLRFRIEHNGEAMPILPIEYMDFLGQVGEASM